MLFISYMASIFKELEAKKKKKGGKKKIKVFELILLRWKRKNLQENRGADFSLKCGTSFLS